MTVIHPDMIFLSGCFAVYPRASGQLSHSLRTNESFGAAVRWLSLKDQLLHFIWIMCWRSIPQQIVDPQQWGELVSEKMLPRSFRNSRVFSNALVYALCSFRKSWPRQQLSTRLVCSAMDASMGGSDSGEFWPVLEVLTMITLENQLINRNFCWTSVLIYVYLSIGIFIQFFQDWTCETPISAWELTERLGRKRYGKPAATWPVR